MSLEVTWDAIVVGSGAAGGWAAKELAERGMSVLLLDAGSLAAPPLPGASAARGRHLVQSKCYAFGASTHPYFVDDVDNPYVTEGGSSFDWIRSRVVGGRMLLWDAVSLRMSDQDFRARDLDGQGDNWPFCYADLAPFYDVVEQFIGVAGTRDGLKQIPDGKFVAAQPLNPLEQHFRTTVESRFAGTRVVAVRRATVGHERTLGAALATRRVVLRPDAVVARVCVDPSGRATGVELVDWVSRATETARGRVVVLCASALESTRILLNSKSEQFPRGLGNSSGTLGRFLMDHTFLNLRFRGVVPRALARAARATSEAPGRCYVAPFEGGRRRRRGFTRPYGVELAVWMPRDDLRFRLRRALGTDDRRSFARRLVSSPTCEIDAGAIGEVLPRSENCISLDPEKKDAWGIPVAKIRFERSEVDAATVAAMTDDVTEMVGAAFEIVHRQAQLHEPGRSIHEMGTARMGSDARTSVLNAHNQLWDCANVFVTDGASFASGGSRNPTLTIMAMTVRASRYIAREAEAGRL